MPFVFSGLQAFPQEMKAEAENGVRSGSLTIQKNISGYSGSGYVGRFENSSDKLTLSVPVISEGEYDIFIGYCSEYGTKIINVEVNGTRSALEIPKQDGKFHEVKFGTMYLKSGEIQVIITPNWTWFHIDYVRFIKSDNSGTGFTIPESPVNPNSNQVTKNLYSFLKNNFQKKTVSGVMTLKSLSNSTNEITYLKSVTGKEPALLGLDFMDHTNSNWVNNPDLVKDAITWWKRNGIVALCWHWRDPSRKTTEFYTEKTSFDITTVNNPESDGYKAMIQDMDVVAGYLKQLQDSGVAILWRPLHEAAGGWFWWGAKGADPCIKLWRLMYDRFTGFHHLNNLIWVWTTTDDSKALTWYPGDSCVDILGMDIYPGEYQHGSQIISFSRVKEIFGGKRIITLSECGSIPYPEQMQADGAFWSYFMPWYGTHTKDPQHNSADDWKKILGSDFVITLDEMPKLSAYTASSTIRIENRASVPVKVSREAGSLHLLLPGAGENFAVRLFSVSGKLLFQDLRVNGTDFSIPLAGYHTGIYLLHVSGNNCNEVIKFFRQKTLSR
jgi:mannan endo-1,4-beta-mannosidase